MPLVKKWQLDEHITTIPIDHPDDSIKPDHLYPYYTDVNFLWLAMKGKLGFPDYAGYGIFVFCTVPFTDKAVEGLLTGNYTNLAARYESYTDPVVGVRIWSRWYVDAGGTGHHELFQWYAGTTTRLGEYTKYPSYPREAFKFKLECIGSTVNGYRVNMDAAEVTGITDVTTSGYWGIKFARGDQTGHGLVLSTFLRATGSSYNIKYLYLTKVTQIKDPEDGMVNTPLLPSLHEPEDSPFNKLQLNWGACYSYDFTEVLLLIPEQERPEYCLPIEDCLKALEDLGGEKFTKTQAIEWAYANCAKAKAEALKKMLG